MAEPPSPPKSQVRAPAIAKPASPAPGSGTPAAAAGAPAQSPGGAVVPEVKSEGPTPSATMNSLAQIPAKSVRKAEGAAAAHGGVVQATDAVVTSDVPAAPRPTRPAATASTELAPGVSATAEVNAAQEASSAFRTFVANARIGGVVAGSSPRVIVNGRLIRAGEVVDSGLGIVFDGVTGNQLVFKDRSGATVSRRY